MIDQILAAYREATFDFRKHAHPADPFAHRFEDWVPYYRLKFAIAKACALTPEFRQLFHGTIANTRAGKPEPSFGFGKLTTAIAPDSGT